MWATLALNGLNLYRIIENYGKLTALFQILIYTNVGNSTRKFKIGFSWKNPVGQILRKVQKITLGVK